MKYIDVICIGAINYDYMFQGKKSDTKNNSPDSGEETMGQPLGEIENEIKELLLNKRRPITQIGGSALLALKTIHAIDKSLSISYVGVWGQLNELEKRCGSIFDIEGELAFIDNQEWLFHTNDSHIGKSVVRFYKNDRKIKISNGANDLLLDFIKKKEKDENVHFEDFLAQAKWIHISSLSTFDQFKEIMAYVSKAQYKNRFLKVSIDPGFQYTKYQRDQLISYLRKSDYVFLNEKEYNNLIINEDMAYYDKYIKLASYFNVPGDIKTKVCVIKRKDKHELIDFVNGVPYVYFHNKISRFQVYNDTGAGDCFAGGFIAGLLSDKLIAQQPAAIDLGVIAARIRMTTLDNEEVYNNIEDKTKKFFLRNYKNGRNSKKRKILFFFKAHYRAVCSFIGGAIATYIIERILSVLLGVG